MSQRQAIMTKHHGSGTVLNQVASCARRSRVAAAAFTVLIFSLMPAGCQNLNEDLADITRGLTMPTPGEAARMMFNQYDPDERRRGTMLIANSVFGGDEEYIRAYHDMVLNERDPIVKAVAIRALARHGRPEHAPDIAAHLQHENEQVRWEAAKAMQRLHNPIVIQDMLTLLRDDTQRSDIRVALADALGQYPQDRAFQGLIAAIDHRELAVNRAAHKSLMTLTGEDFGMDSRAWLDWYDPIVRAGGDPFAGQQDYLFPTYQRDATFFEQIAFWTTPKWEHPALPAGLRSSEARSTYEDEDAADKGDG